ncbi:MAG: lytic transglycosylase domain-containing protein [Candidatus Aureabacteria bacterium]|nr:lytic transglycosylase domain-containing protein [Candidatus Auribacterota bacterium]
MAGGGRSGRSGLGGQPTLREAAQELGLEGIGDYVPGEILDGYALPGPGDWKRFWRTLQKVRESGSLEDFAWLRPQVEQAVSALESVEGGADWADWLRQELDYFEVAGDVTRRIPAAGPPPAATPAPPPAARRPVTLAPPPSPRPVPVPAAVAKERSDAVSSLDLWKKKLAGRPVPPRAKAILPGLKKIFRAEGVPPELVWLAEVESSFNPNAQSPAGARGLFQFMPATAQRFGLPLRPEDARLHPEKIASAAARYLNFLYGKFQSWPLAIAAYNAGEGNVGRALKKSGAKTFSGVVYHLPTETQMYVPKVLATVELREGVAPEKIPPAVGTATGKP